ncbi:transporter substrate-binding domain-containing protein [Notoacmeibacter sp. MSK16QG-6]|uniref:transporter substrate-binding domain-containing protein n=1 Tax=Notoacmeibacter sp. MSK16QG-6 TaxID=2957982 RepID=UPI0020A12547|nr:transporter substrate-binding domain-containing protein [Notoacmeibacter sp. MSK16QG-6]MCP1201011.1 transporter substrate-binding domain-containing protein [Notoacmeibacter sp. MSK16QG-6]
MEYKSKRRAVRGILTAVLFAVGGAGAALAQDLPPIPEAIKEAGVLKVGTKCDYPPDGYLDNSGNPIGIEVAMGHQIAKYAFGDDAKAQIICVTSANRIPLLVGGQVDLVFATMGITAERAEVIDFTQPYAWSSSGMVVLADNPINSLSELDGKKIALVKGAWQIDYFKKNYPEIGQLLFDTASESLQALMTGYVDGYAHDTPVLMTLALNNSKIRLIDESYNIGQRGGGVRKGETEWLDFVNASLTKMADEGKFKDWLTEFADDENLDVKLNFWDMSKKPAE